MSYRSTSKHSKPSCCSTKHKTNDDLLESDYFIVHYFKNAPILTWRSIAGNPVDQGVVAVAGLDNDAGSILLHDSFVEFQHVAWWDGWVFALADVLHESVEVVDQDLAVALTEFLDEGFVVFLLEFTDYVLEEFEIIADEVFIFEADWPDPQETG